MTWNFSLSISLSPFYNTFPSISSNRLLNSIIAVWEMVSFFTGFRLSASDLLKKRCTGSGSGYFFPFPPTKKQPIQVIAAFPFLHLWKTDWNSPFSRPNWLPLILFSAIILSCVFMVSSSVSYLPLIQSTHLIIAAFPFAHHSGYVPNRSISRLNWSQITRM